MAAGLFTFDDTSVPGARMTLGQRAQALGFEAGSDNRTGALLRALVATKAGGRFLELGTGVGMATAWMLDGMTATAQLESVDVDRNVQNIVREVLGDDPRLVLHLVDGADFIKRAAPSSYDLVFADAWPGKFDERDATLALLRPGGIYVVDDLLPQPNWPDNHQPRSDALVASLEADPMLLTLRLDWSTGLMLAIKRG